MTCIVKPWIPPCISLPANWIFRPTVLGILGVYWWLYDKFTEQALSNNTQVPNPCPPATIIQKMTQVLIFLISTKLLVQIACHFLDVIHAAYTYLCKIRRCELMRCFIFKVYCMYSIFQAAVTCWDFFFFFQGHSVKSMRKGINFHVRSQSSGWKKGCLKVQCDAMTAVLLIWLYTN